MGVSNITLAPPAKLVVRKASKPSVVKPQLVVERTASRSGSSTSSTATATGPQQTEQSSIADRPSRPTAATATSAVKRRVHFSTASGCNSPSTTSSTEPLTVNVHTIPSSSELDDHDKAQLWWTKEERRELLERNQRMVEVYLRRNYQHVLSVRQVFRDECCRSLAVVTSDDDASSSSSLSASSSSEDSSDDDDDEEELFASSRKRGRRGRRSPLHEMVHKRQRLLEVPQNKMSLPTSIRGLEYGILPEAKGHRRLHRKRVLDWQERIKSQWTTEQCVLFNECIDVDSNSQQHLATVLEQQSLLSSHRSRRLAELLAASDAEEDSCKGFAATGTTMSGCHYAPTTAAVRRARPRMMW